MKWFTCTLTLLICVCLLAACQNNTATSIPENSQENWTQADQAPAEDTVPEDVQKRWTQLDQAPSELAEPTVAVPDVFLGMSYDDALQAAIDANIAELVWVGKTILSPSGEKAVYSTNKNDLVHGTFSLVLLDLRDQTEQVVADTDAQSVYPLWWWDEDHLVYEVDSKYYLLDVSSREQPITLSLPGDTPYILSYDQNVFIMTTSTANTTERSVCKITEGGTPEIVATYTPGEGRTFMAECDVSQALHLAAFKERNESDVRAIVLLDYETGRAEEIPMPEQSQNGEITLIDLCFSDEKLVAFFSDRTEDGQVWEYDLSH